MSSPKTAKTANKAHHVAFPDQFVTFSFVKDFAGTKLVKVIFSNGERTTLSISRFNELYVIVK